MNGMKWQLNESLVDDIMEFQSDEGKPISIVKLKYFGGITNIMVNPEEMTKFRKFKGQMVACSGNLDVEVKKNGSTKVTFGLDSIRPIEK